MAVTNWSTKASNIAEPGSSVRLYFHTQYADDGVTVVPVHPEDDTLRKAARIEVVSRLYPDANANPQLRILHYRLAASSAGHDGAADGSGPSAPLPLDTGDAALLDAVQTVLQDLKKQWRSDANGDVE